MATTSRRIANATREIIRSSVKTVKTQRFASSSSANKNTPFFIFGLGNPGEKYAKTRHNIGWLCLEQIAKKYNIDMRQEKFQSIYGEGMVGNKKIILIKPTTFMNLSGRSVRQWLDFYKATPADSITILDAAELDLGSLRLRQGGSSGGQNGMGNIIEILKTKDIPRIKVGIGAPPRNTPLIDWVLGHWQPAEHRIVDETLGNVTECVDIFLKQGWDRAASSFNKTYQDIVKEKEKAAAKARAAAATSAGY